ncbi:MAG: hypothetical protein HUJ56_04320, partial [Erysipelotrichaceae bacterium]|nr:hypothetical protein [Erysipelotrichaceae bacterium]
MRSFKVISRFDVVPITLWLCVFLLMNNPWLRVLIGLITIGYFLSSNKYNLILWGVLVLVVLRPMNHSVPEVFEGSIIHVNTYGYVVEVEHSKVLVNTEEVLHLDDVITYTGEYVPISNNLSTFGYNKQLTYQKKGIYYEIYPTTIEIIHSKSIIHKLYVKCYELQDQMVMGLLFNVSEEENIFLSLGLGLTLFLMSLRKTLSQFINEKIVTIGLLVVVGYLYLSYSYEYALLRLLVYLLLELTSLKGKEKAAVNGLLLMVLMPSNVASVSFLLPFYFRLQNGLKRKKSETILGSWFIQSFYMNQVNPLMLVVFTFYRSIIGILFGIAFIQVLTGLPLITYLYPVLTYVSNFTNKFVLQGNVRGIGLVLYALLFEVLGNFKQKEILRIFLFILFMYLGL